MGIFDIITVVLLIIYVCVLLYFLRKNGKTIKFLLVQALISVLLLTLINLTSSLTGLFVPVNECTVLGVSIGGIPMIFCFLLLKMIFVL